ncbi:MAG TPA: LamG-like jellyroll fold domain-containing protein [Bacillota bacterium]|nr:LamG-like jellyroll fold domain-containing protein [Bacillota bacterium]
MKTFPYSLAATLIALASTSAVQADYSNTVMSLNPIAYYPLNETAPVSADMAANLGTAGAVGTGLYINSPSHQAPGALAGSSDTAVSFAGTTQRMSVPFDPAITPTGPFTAEAWANPATTTPGGGFGTVMSHCNFPGTRWGWAFYQVNAGWELRMNNGVNSANAVDITGGGTPTVGKWYHLVAVYDGTNASLYVNGTRVGQAAANGIAPNNGGAFSVGGRYDKSAFPFAGALDEVALYTNALSATEISLHYQTGTNSAPSTGYNTLVQAQHPLLYYRLNEPTYTDGPAVTAANQGTLGSGADGIYEAGATTGVAGPPFAGFGTANTAMRISAVAGDVIIPPQPVYVDTFTITCWFKRTGYHQNGQALVSNRQADQQKATGLGFGYNSPGADQLNVHWNEGPSTWLPGLTPPNNVWCFAAAVYTPTNVTVYLDNLTNTYTTALAPHDFSLASTYIGWDFPWTRCEGTIDEVAMFDRPLSPSEVQSLLAASQMPPQVLSISRTPADPIYEGATITLTPTVAGIAPWSYQWYKNNAPLIGKTNSTFAITNALIADSGSYFLVVTNSYGAATSAVQTLTVQGSRPLILAQPTSFSGYVGGPVTFAVSAGGSLPLTYQWKRDGAPIAGATTASLTLPNIQWGDSGSSYICTIANAYGTTNTTTVTLTVAGQFAPMTLPGIGRRDRHTALGTDGTNLFFTWGAPGNPSLYRLPEGALTNWTPLASLPLPPTWDNDSGVGDLSYFGGALWTLARSPANSGARAVYRYDLAGDAWTAGADIAGSGPDAAIAVLAETNILGGWIGWTRVKQITDWQNGTAGDVGDLAGGAVHPWDACIGPDNVYYIKHYNVATTAGVLAGINKTNTTSITNIPGMPFNPGMGCAVEYLPGNLFTNGHARLYVLRGGTGTGDNDGQGWKTATTANQLAVYDLVSRTWTLQTLPFGVDDGSEMCLVHQTLYVLAANGDPQPLKMLYLGAPVAPIVAQQPIAQTVYVGQPVTLTVSPFGGGPFSYQWRRDGVNIAGATGNTLTLSNADYADNASYDVVVTNPVGTTNSAPAHLTVLVTPMFANLTNDLVLHLKFDGDCNDASSLANIVFPIGSPTFIPGRIGSGAVHLNTDVANGLYNYVSVLPPADQSLSFGPADSFSVAFWIKYTGAVNDLPILGNAVNSTYQRGWVFSEEKGQIEWTLVSSESGGGQVIADPVGGPLINNGTWHHIVATFDRASGMASTYVDGAPIDSRDISAVSSLDVVGNNLTLGQDPTGGYQVSGAYDLDDLGIWRRALSPTDAQAIYKAAQQNVSFDTYGPVQLTARRSPTGALELIWQAGTLLQSDTVNGTYSPVTGATAPYYRVTPGATPKFYRIKL